MRCLDRIADLAKLHNEEQRNWYPSSNIVRRIKSNRTTCKERVVKKKKDEKLLDNFGRKSQWEIVSCVEVVIRSRVQKFPA